MPIGFLGCGPSGVGKTTNFKEMLHQAGITKKIQLFDPDLRSETEHADRSAGALKAVQDAIEAGENFGYTIAESLSCSIPIIISKNTPFKDISKYGFGYDIDIFDNEMFCNTLSKFAKMNQDDYNNFRFNLNSNFKKLRN
jgi:glycosyltransferase involved in cell wall biosynthesis